MNQGSGSEVVVVAKQGFFLFKPHKKHTQAKHDTF
jgi:hypothetical protein